MGTKILNNKFLLLFFLCIFIIHSNITYSEVVIEKLDQIVNWDNQEFYKDALTNLEIAKQIKQESKMRKKLKDAGFSQDEIAEIMQNKNNKQQTKFNNNDYNKQKAEVDEKNQDENSIYDNDNKEIGEELEYDDNEMFLEQNNDNNGVRKNGKVTNNSKSKKIKYIVNEEDYDNDDYNDDIEYVLVRKNKKRTTLSQYDNDQNLIEKSNQANNDNIQYNTENNNDNSLLKPEIQKTSSEARYKLDNDGYKLLYMLEKTGKNMNNKETFEIFSKELGRIARNGLNKSNQNKYLNLNNNLINNQQTNKNEIIKISNTINNNHFNAESNKSKFSNKLYANKVLKPIKNNDSGKLYAYTAKSVNAKKSETDTNNNNAPIDNKNSVINDIRNEYDYSNNVSLDDSFINRNTLTEGQLKAKELGSPQPVLRANNNHKTQISPQNILQVQYDNNNQHLKPAVFQSQIIDDVFKHLSDNNTTELVKALIGQVGKVDIVDKDNNTLLMHAVALKNQSLITMLLSEGANPNIVNNDGFTALHLAATNADDTSLYYMLLSGGNPNKKDKDGYTPFMYCAMNCSLSTIKMMVDAGADINIVNDFNKNKTIIDYAMLNSDKDVLNYISELSSSDKKRKTIDITPNI